MVNPPDSVHARLEALFRHVWRQGPGLADDVRLDKHGIDPADVEQEVRIRLWRALERDRSGAFAASYIQRVVASTVIDALRRAEVRAAEPLPDEDDEPGSVGEDPIGPDRRAGDVEQYGRARTLPPPNPGTAATPDHAPPARVSSCRRSLTSPALRRRRRPESWSRAVWKSSKSGYAKWDTVNSMTDKSLSALYRRLTAKPAPLALDAETLASAADGTLAQAGRDNAAEVLARSPREAALVRMLGALRTESETLATDVSRHDA